MKQTFKTDLIDFSKFKEAKPKNGLFILSVVVLIGSVILAGINIWM